VAYYFSDPSKWREAQILASTLTPEKVINYILLVISYFISKVRGKPTHWGKPFSISVEPTTSCNLRCPECPSGLRSFTRPTGMLNEPQFTALTDELKPWLTYLTFYFQGEPYLNPKFLDMVKIASNRNIYTSTSTNAHYLNDENCLKTISSGLKRIIISIDGTTQETYESYRIGGSLEKVIAGTRNLIGWKTKMKSATPHIIFQFLVVKPNEHQINEIYALAGSLGVNEVKLKTAQVYDFENGSPLIPTQDQYSRYRQNTDGKWSIKNNLLNQCWQMWHSCVVTWDGKVVPCCFDKDAHHVLGETTKASFLGIWKSPAYHNFRQLILHSRSKIDICTNCTEGTKVWG